MGLKPLPSSELPEMTGKLTTKQQITDDVRTYLVSKKIDRKPNNSSDSRARDSLTNNNDDLTEITTS